MKMNKFTGVLKVVNTVTIEPNKSALVPIEAPQCNDLFLLTLAKSEVHGRPIVMSTGGQVFMQDEEMLDFVYVLIHNTSMSVHLTIDEGTPLVLATVLHKVKDKEDKKDKDPKGSKDKKESIQ